MRDRRSQIRILLSLLIVALVLRLIAFILGVDRPGDGPTRAIQAYNWAQSPYLATHGIRLPGFLYLSGSFSWIVGDPLFSTRLLNLMMGTATVPMFYALVRNIYGPTIAFLSAAILACLPLHIGLSTSSLTEASFLFEVIMGIYFLLIGAEQTKFPVAYLILALLFLCLAVMTRYEAWLLIPLFPAYYFWKTRKLTAAVLLLGVLLISPLAWSLSNALHTGDPFYGFSAAEIGAEAVRAQAVGLLEALMILVRKSLDHLGWFLVLALIAGGAVQLVQAVKGRIAAERLFYVSILGTYWLVMLHFTMVRGTSLWARYLLFGLVMTLPLAALPVIRYVEQYRLGLSAFLGLALLFVGIAQVDGPSLYVTRQPPGDIQRVAAWLRQSPFRDNPILLTKMGWRSTYLPLYAPEIGPRFRIVSFWISDAALMDFVRSQPLSLLVTRDGDEAFQARLKAIGVEVDDERLIHTEGPIKIYALRP